MITNLPRQRDLWILLLVVILGTAVIVVLRTGVPATTEVASGGGAEASASLAPSAAPTESAAPTGSDAPIQSAGSTDPAQAPSLDSLPPDTRAQFDALPEGYVLVACNSSVAKFPEGVSPHKGPGWMMMHPGWQVLLHGYCVDNPSMIRSFEPQVLDAP